jgi:hypothetical protein
MIRIVIALALSASAALAADKSFEELWQRAIVTIEVTRKQYDHLQPWSRRVDQISKMGTIIGKNEILTTADHLSNHTLVRLQKGRGRWFEGRVTWIDYHANLATVSTGEEAFWEGAKEVDLAKTTPRRGAAQVVRWRNGILEFRNVDISRLVVKRGKLTFMDQLQLELDSDMQGIGWAEAVVQDDKLIGITASKDDQTITTVPSSFILSRLADRAEGDYQGLGYFSFVWQTAENPDTLAFLGQEGEPRGVVIIEVQTNNPASPLLRRDIILEIDGFKIDVQGDYNDPDYGNLLLENLASRNKNAGDVVKIKIERAGKEMTVDYILPKAEYGVQLVPLAVPDREPEYLILGGLVFQPLTVPFLQSWGADWNRKAPFHLSYATREESTPSEPSVVVMSMVLPDPVNIGYQEARMLLVDKLNGKRIFRLEDLIAAASEAKEGFHLIEFRRGDSLRRMVLDAAELDAATLRVLERYGIQKDRVLSPPLPGKPDKLAEDQSVSGAGRGL